MSSNFWDDDAKPVAKPIAPKNAPTVKVEKNSFWDDDAKPAASGGFWDDEDAPKGQQMTMARGEERRQIDANPQAMHEAEAEGFNTPEAQAHLSQYKPREPASPLMSGARAVTSSALMGFDDEATGLVGGAVGGLQGNGFVSSYKNSRDRTRAENDAAIKDNPGSSMIGSFVGGMAVPGINALKAGRIGGAIANGALTAGAMGAVQGLGDSKDITDLPQVAKDVGVSAGKGAVLGGIVGAGAHAVTNPGQITALPGYAKAMFKGATKGAAATWPFGAKGQAIGIPLGAMKGALNQYKKNGAKLAEEAVEKSVHHPPIKIGNPPANKLVEDAQAFGQKALDAGKKYAVNRAVRSGTDAAYNAATGTDEGLPDPLRDQATEFLKKKFDLTDSQAEAMKKAMPSVYDLASRGGKAISKAHDNYVPKKIGAKIDEPRGQFVMDRDVNHNGEKLRHEVYRDGSQIIHQLVDENGRRVAEIKGHMRNYKGDSGLAIGWSNSTTKGEGHGKKLYDLVLDTHDKVFSDDTLSPQGSRKVYEKHYAYSPGVHVDFDTPGTSDRFKVRFHDKNMFRNSKGIDPFPMDHSGNLKDVNKIGFLSRLGLNRGSPQTIDVPSRPSLEHNFADGTPEAMIMDMAGGDWNIGQIGRRLADKFGGDSRDYQYMAQNVINRTGDYAEARPRTSEGSRPERGPASYDGTGTRRPDQIPLHERTRAMVVDHVNQSFDRGLNDEQAYQSARRDIGVNFDAIREIVAELRSNRQRRGPNGTVVPGERPTEAPIDPRVRQRVEQEARTIFSAGGTHEDAMKRLSERFGLTSDNVRRVVDEIGGPNPTRQVIDRNPGESDEAFMSRLAEQKSQRHPSTRDQSEDFKDTDIPFKNEDMNAQKTEQFDELNERGAASKATPGTGPLSQEEIWKVTEAAEKFAENGGSIDDARDYLAGTYGIHPDRLGNSLDASFENAQNAVSSYDNRRVDRPRPDQARTSEALQRMKEDRLEGPDARGFMQLKDDFHNEQHKGGYRLDWEQISDKATRVNRARRAEIESHRDGYQHARENNTEEYQDFRLREQSRRDRQRAQHEQEQQENTLRSKLDEDMTDDEMRATANRVAPRERGEIDERVIENFRAERMRSKMHPVGSEAPTPITLQDQVARVQRERAEAAENRKAKQWNSFMEQVERTQNKTPPRPARRLSVVPSESEMKAMLKRKKDKK